MDPCQRGVAITGEMGHLHIGVTLGSEVDSELAGNQVTDGPAGIFHVIPIFFVDIRVLQQSDKFFDIIRSFYRIYVIFFSWVDAESYILLDPL